MALVDLGHPDDPGVEAAMRFILDLGRVHVFSSLFLGVGEIWK